MGDLKMSKKYKEVKLNVYNLEDCVNCLLDYKKTGELVSTKFNGVELFSDVVTMDEAYKSITGITKQEHDKLLENTKEKYKRECEEHNKLIPNKIESFKSEGRLILDEKYWKLWEEIVPIRLSDLYLGMELNASLQIIKVLNKTGDLYKAKEIIESQNHSGMSFQLVCSMIKTFCNKGEEFVNFVSC